MSIQTVRAILTADAQTSSYVGGRIGPLQAIQGESPPYIVLSVVSSEPFNSLSGFAGLNRTEIEMSAWAFDYQTAVLVANAARSAVEASGNFTLREPGDEFAFQQDTGLYRHAYVFQIFD